MKSAAISELKAKLGEYLKLVRAGEEIIILSHGKPVAKIVSVEENEPKKLSEEERRKMTREECREDMIRKGLLIPAQNKELPPDFWDRERPKDPDGLALKLLREERDEGW